MVRADAAKNREQILAVAREAFGESTEASMIGIARRAGVGAGTLYRHFPTREALLVAVYRDEVERLVGAVPRMLADHSPLDAFRAWFWMFAEAVRFKYGLGDALQAPVLQEEVSGTVTPMVAAVRELLAACAADGSMRPGLDAEDVLVVMAFMTRIDRLPGGPDQAERAMDLVLTGLGLLG
ncbi:TetR/AcrR family transcriptional regulator [Cryptosporangium sp. NPDC048952]|uniref:TetR/AcrR family transcriptional regulator n=1 Tax=Cryptosporangium sp. NPDC048952 TaxID=3363961 RepID=UPI003714312D